MTKNQKTGLRIAGISLLVVAGLAVPASYFAFQHRQLQSRLEDPNPAVRVAAIRSIGYEGNVDLLMKALQDDDADVRLVAAGYLQRHNHKAVSAIDALITALRDKHAGVRREAAEALSIIGAPAAPALVKALEDPDPHVRVGAIRGLSDAPKDVRDRSAEELELVIPAMKKLLQDEDPEVRRKAARFLELVRER